MAVPDGKIINSPTESSEEEFNSDSENSYSSEDDLMEEEQSDSDDSSLSSPEQQVIDQSNKTEDEFWVRNPYFKIYIDQFVRQGWFSESVAYEKSKLIPDEKAKEMNDRCKALSIAEMELVKSKCELLHLVVSEMAKAST